MNINNITNINDILTMNDISHNETYDMNLFSVLNEEERTSSVENIFRPIPLLNTQNEDTNILENILLAQPMEQQLNTLFTHFFPEHVEYDSSTSDSLYDEPSYKNVISEAGKKELIHTTYTQDLNTDTCPILQVQFNEGDAILKLPCEHYFEPSAITTWLQNEKAECPVCRYKLKHIEIKNT